MSEQTTTIWTDAFSEALKLRGVEYTADACQLGPFKLLQVRDEDWSRVAMEAKSSDCRWAASWAEDHGNHFIVNVCLQKADAYLIVRTSVPHETPVLASHTPFFAAADRPERHIQDMFGIAFLNHPDTRRWTRHQAWQDTEFPLRKNFPVAGTRTEPTPPDDQYRFLAAQGAGVYEIPVGPVHAGIIEPGHFRFQAVGEFILNLEQHLGYVHKGIEKIAAGRDGNGLARLAGRISGDSTVAHAWAACMAMENAANITIPERAAYLRAIMCERERVINHLGDIGAILNDVAFAFGFYQFGRLREDWTRVSQRAFGHRFMMDCIIPGGVARDLADADSEAMRKQISTLIPELKNLKAIVDDNASVEDRLETTGILSLELAKSLGCVGYVGRASGQDFDVRRDCAYAPYDRYAINVPSYHYGDVAARLKVRAEEILASCELLEQMLADLPAGALAAAWPQVPADAEGLGIIDGWRGEIVSYVRFAEEGKIARFFPRDPSWLTWPALEKMVRDNIVPDFPVCNKSVNGSYSGQDL